MHDLLYLLMTLSIAQPAALNQPQLVNNKPQPAQQCTPAKVPETPCQRRPKPESQ
jgi:hypothetical protein